MPLVTVKELVESGVHFGHQASLWNPKMKPYIHGKKNLIHVIDLRQTVKGLVQARHFLFRLASMGAQMLFVGTKRQIKDVVSSGAERCGMPVVTERWIGGSLTNYHTIRSRLDRLEELERLQADGTLDKYSKKLQSRLRREMRKITRNLGGIRNLSGLPGAVVVIDPRREDIAVREAAKMNVPIIAILDTDCDPDLVDIPIPGNDDALRSVQVLLNVLVDAVVEGRQNLRSDAQFRSDVPELKGREEPDRTRGPRQPRGKPAGRVAGGRFADRSAGHAEAVSFGRGEANEEAAPSSEPAPEKTDAPADAPPADAPPADAPPADAPAADAAPEAPAGDSDTASKVDESDPS